MHNRAIFLCACCFAKKGAHKNVGDNVYSTVVHSFTKGTDSLVAVSKDYIKKGDRILIIDDFLANGKAAFGLIDIVKQAGANVAGMGIVIEKGFQKGGEKLREMGINLKSLAVIRSMDDEGNIEFEENE